MTELRFDGRVVVVTGAGRGMGRVHAETFAARGAKVIVSDVGATILGTGVDEAVAQDVVKEIRAAGGEAIAYTADLGTEAGARGAVKCALENYGRLDVLVHNAGIALGSMPCERESMERLGKLNAVNTDAAYAMLCEVWPVMQRQGYGRVILVGSSAMYGAPLNLPYATAKASYIGIVRSLAGETAPHDIKINLLCPSGVSRLPESMPESEFRRWFMATMKPELVSAVVALLGHQECSVNGEMFAVAGGRVARIVVGETAGFIKSDLTAEDVRDNMAKIMDEGRITTFHDYAESAVVLMKALGFSPKEEIGLLSAPPPKP